MALKPSVEPLPLSQFLDLLTQSVGILGWGMGLSQGRYLHAEYEHGRTQTFMPQMELEPMILEFELVKTMYAVNCAATVVGEILNGTF
jgi:hypothetical protein